MRPGQGARGGEACFRRAGGGGGLQSFLAPQAPRLPCPARICLAAEGAAWVAGGLTPELAQRPLQRLLFPGLRPQGTSRHLEPVPTPQCSAPFQARRAAGARLRAWGAPPARPPRRSESPQREAGLRGSRTALSSRLPRSRAESLLLSEALRGDGAG